MRVAICPGSFDPITLGHLDIIERSAYIYDKVIVGVTENPAKKPLFSLEERVLMAAESVAHLENVTVESFDGLLVEFSRDHNSSEVVKGLRAVSDFEHEFQMAHLNKTLNSQMETVFLMASPEYMFLSSSAVKEVALYGGAVKGLVSANVESRLRERFNR